jgi:hypothetical protein
VLSDTALQTVVDSAWSRRYRWRVFRPVRELTAKYSADAGRLPPLLRRYVDQNMLQPYLDTAIPQRLDRGAVQSSVLDDERRKWVDFWETRLKQFGYSFDVY